MLYIEPDIVAYIANHAYDDEEDDGDINITEVKADANAFSEFYKHNGFRAIGDSYVLYAFADL